ncbi:EI24 domain-containing protein [Sphingomonas sp. MMS24-J45]|uniref:EI24 domain-containing protein n=1 Tax=Sphingomonas sp. MMS24-J45 TaxID=3238806 RepID=UPI00384C2680
MLNAFLLSLAQLGDRKIVGVFLKSFALTVALIALFGAGLWYVAERWVAALGWNADVGILAGTVALLITFGLGWLLFRAVAVAVMGVFADDVVIAVERKHYPAALAKARDVSIARGIGLGLRSAGRAILINLALAPVYIMLLVTGVGTALLFFLVNGWLLGNDFGQMVAARHMDDAMMRDWRKTGAVDRFALGVAGTALFMVPILNLFAPVIGAAMATHLFHKGRNA